MSSYVPEARRYPPLPAPLAQELARVGASGGRYDPIYYPCSARLKSGSLLECVYFSEAEKWIESWGVWPSDDSGKAEVAVEEIENVLESPFRLPAKFANKLYEAGETGMGGYTFTIAFRDGSRVVCSTGSAVDFVRYPTGQSAASVVDVIPHLGRGERGGYIGPDYVWCLYGNA